MEWANQNGHKIGISTGRPFEAAKKAVSQIIGLTKYISSFNGSYAEQDNKVIMDLKVNDLNVLKLKDSTSIPFSVSYGEGDDIFIDDFSPKHTFDDIIKRTKPTETKTINDLSNISCRVLRLIVHDTEDLFSLYEVAKKFFPNLNVCTSTERYVLVTPKEATKAKALMPLLDEKVYFFGDSGNDEDVFLLKHDNLITVAPANATKEIKDKANIVLSSTNNEGFSLETIINKTK